MNKIQKAWEFLNYWLAVIILTFRPKKKTKKAIVIKEYNNSLYSLEKNSYSWLKISIKKPKYANDRVLILLGLKISVNYNLSESLISKNVKAPKIVAKTP